jgi:hypothetical protein
LLAALPPYALIYDPTVIPSIGKGLEVVNGLTGAAGEFYPNTDPVAP